MNPPPSGDPAAHIHRTHLHPLPKTLNWIHVNIHGGGGVICQDRNTVTCSLVTAAVFSPVLQAPPPPFHHGFMGGLYNNWQKTQLDCRIRWTPVLDPSRTHGAPPPPAELMSAASLLRPHQPSCIIYAVKGSMSVCRKSGSGASRGV